MDGSNHQEKKKPKQRNEKAEEGNAVTNFLQKFSFRPKSVTVPASDERAVVSTSRGNQDFRIDGFQDKKKHKQTKEKGEEGNAVTNFLQQFSFQPRSSAAKATDGRAMTPNIISSSYDPKMDWIHGDRRCGSTSTKIIPRDPKMDWIRGDTNITPRTHYDHPRAAVAQGDNAVSDFFGLFSNAARIDTFSEAFVGSFADMDTSRRPEGQSAYFGQNVRSEELTPSVRRPTLQQTATPAQSVDDPVGYEKESPEEKKKRLELEQKRKIAKEAEEEKKKLSDFQYRHRMAKRPITDDVTVRKLASLLETPVQIAARQRSNMARSAREEHTATGEGEKKKISELDYRRRMRERSTLVRQEHRTTIEEAQALYMQNRLGTETPEQTFARLNSIPGSMEWFRQIDLAAAILRPSTSAGTAAVTVEENPDEERRRLNRERQRKYRDKKRSEEAVAIPQGGTGNKDRRSRETAAQREKRQEDDAARHRLARQRETPDERERRLAAVALSMSQHRDQETPAQTAARRRADAEAHADRRLRNAQRLAFIQRFQQVQQIGSEHFDESVVAEHNCGEMNQICQFCGSQNFVAERPQDKMFINCCKKGNFLLQKPVDSKGIELNYPSFLQDLLSNPENENYRNFRDNIRSYNSALSFASMGAKIVAAAGRGPYVFTVNGQVHHRTSHLEAVDGQPKFAQLYVLDSSTQAVDARMALPANEGCIREVMYQIDGFFRRHNRLTQTYQMMKDIQQAEEQKAIQEGRPAPVVRMEMRRNRESDQRIYNINILSSNLDPMTYALLYPYGEPGWHRDFVCNNKKVSMLQYKAAQLAIRNTFNPILSAGKLTQQWIVDSYLQVEANNLNFIRRHQDKLRAEQYQGLADHVARQAEAVGAVAGTPVILPSSFSGSPRNMRERLQDAMCIFGKFGVPDLFVTFTANPSWSEIQNNLKPGEIAVDRPDLVARVFKQKLDALIKDITVNMVLGFAVAHVYTIEFQKRGLPHAHILIVLHEDDKFKTVEKIDQIICAEIPDKVRNPRLYEIVTRCMIHGPCGDANPNATCMENGKCQKEFPKEFNESTKKSLEGYPRYRRREGTYVHIKGHMFDNRHVVPYNKYLTLKYNAHINVECCTSVRAIKYIYKYIYKGFDCADVMISEDGKLIHDEITNYINARYVSAPEAMWRLLVFVMHDRSYSIVRLPVHLDQQQIRFKVGREQEALDQAAGGHTKLTAWFELNKNNPAARGLLYPDIPYHYTFKEGRWQEKVRNIKKISRMYTVSPSDEERFYLRLLLLHVPGATSYEYLRTVDGIIYPTFKIAALYLNLLADDDEWDQCLQEAVTFQMPPQMRQTFAYICIYCAPHDRLGLWNEFKEHMIVDFRRNYDEATSYNLALHHIESIFKDNNRSCRIYGLPQPTGIAPTVAQYNQQQEQITAERLISTLNKEQLDAFKKIIAAIDTPTNKKLYFLNGPGGCGKSYLYNAFISFVYSRGQTVKAFATTGIAATVIKHATTVHRGFGLPVPLLDISTSRMRPNSPQADGLRQASLIIIDEGTMLTKDGLRCIDRLLKDIMKNNLPFGGKVVVIGGDFRQTLPVVPRGTRAAIIEACLKSSPLWKHFTELTLISNMRSEGENAFNNWLLALGIGNTPRIDGLNDGAVLIPSEMIIDDNIVSTIFGNNVQDMPIHELPRRVILAATNKEALDINNNIIEKLNGEIKIYNSADELQSDEPNDVNIYPTEFLNSLQPSGMPPHKLRLKVGTIVMLLRNLNASKGLCNGTRLIIRKLNERSIICEILSDNHKGDVVILSRIDLAPSDTNLPFTLKRRQFPIIPAFAITINKSQGQTYDFVGINLTEPVFAHGQLYVALSRSRNPANIKVLINECINQGRVPTDWDQFYTQNVVFKEIFP